MPQGIEDNFVFNHILHYSEYVKIRHFCAHSLPQVKMIILEVRVVLSCPDNSLLLQPLDHIIALVQV